MDGFTMAEFARTLWFTQATNLQAQPHSPLFGCPCTTQEIEVYKPEWYNTTLVAGCGNEKIGYHNLTMQSQLWGNFNVSGEEGLHYENNYGDPDLYPTMVFNVSRGDDGRMLTAMAYACFVDRGKAQFAFQLFSADARFSHEDTLRYVGYANDLGVFDLDGMYYGVYHECGYF